MLLLVISLVHLCACPGASSLTTPCAFKAHVQMHLPGHSCRMSLHLPELVLFLCLHVFSLVFKVSLLCVYRTMHLNLARIIFRLFLDAIYPSVGVRQTFKLHRVLPFLSLSHNLSFVWHTSNSVSFATLALPVLSELSFCSTAVICSTAVNFSVQR